MLSHSENVPLTIDAKYVVGVDWLRNPKIRFVQEWNNASFGLSMERPGLCFRARPAASVSPPAPIVTSINNA
jgi:hypothetical protein